MVSCETCRSGSSGNTRLRVAAICCGDHFQSSIVRTTPQAAGLRDALADIGRAVDAILLFDIDEEELVRRLSGRTTCDVCQRPFFGRQPGETCEVDGKVGTLVRRKDDEPEAVRKRLHVYSEQTEPVIDWYATHGGNLVHIDALGTLEEVEGRMLSALGMPAGQ